MSAPTWTPERIKAWRKADVTRDEANQLLDEIERLQALYVAERRERRDEIVRLQALLRNTEHLMTTVANEIAIAGHNGWPNSLYFQATKIRAELGLHARRDERAR